MASPVVSVGQAPDSTHHDEYRALLDRFDPATPDLLARRGLLRRTDTKFLFSTDELVPLIRGLASGYRVLRANGRSIATYRTLYFDTPEMRCFHDHRRGRRPRHKVRFRHYADRELTYLEIKTKRSELVTDKRRVSHPYGTVDLGDSDLAFIREHSSLPASALAPELWTNFGRVTLIGVDFAERITIDTQLELVRSGISERLSGVAIMEVKQSPFCARTPVMRSLRDAGHRPVSASKYCTASALLRRGLRMNRLLPALRLIEGLRS